jgi:hypothetical protein
MRINYNTSNYCTKCAWVAAKQVVRYPECGQKLRTKPYYSSKLTDVKRIYNLKLMNVKRIA